MMRVVAGQHVPKRLIHPSQSDVYGYGYVDLNSHLFYRRDDPLPKIDMTVSDINYLDDFTPDSLSKAATVPPCKWMELHHPRYPWKIMVTAQVPTQGCLAGVTVEDVFTAVFDDLRKDVTTSDAYAVLGTTDALQRHRLSPSRSSRGTSGFSRLKRLHWLGTRSVQFLGITPDKDDPARWFMHFSHDDLPERPLPPLPQVEEDSPPEYELTSTVPSFIVLQQDGVYRAVRIEPYRPQPAEGHLNHHHRDRKLREMRTSISRHRVVV